MTPTALDQSLAQKAIGRFRAARLLLEPWPATAGSDRSAEHLTTYAELRLLTGDREAAAADARRALRLTSASAACLARCQAVLGVAAAEAGAPARSLNRFRRALEAASDADDCELSGWIRLELVVQLADGLGPDATDRMLAECAGRATVGAHPHLHAWLHLLRADIDARRGRLQDASSHLGVACELLATRENLWLEALLGLGRSRASALAGAHAEALAHARGALRHASCSGHLQTHFRAVAALARACLALGELDEAERVCREALERPGAAVRHRMALLDMLARCSLLRGQVRECRQRLAELDDAEPGSSGVPSGFEALSALLTRARLAQAASAWQEALEICERGIRAADEGQDLAHGVSLRCLKADVCRELDRGDIANRTMAEALGMAERAPLPLCGEAMRAHASLRLREPGASKQAGFAFRRALRVLADVGAADARQDGVLGYLRATEPRDRRLRRRLAAKPWDVAPLVRDTLPRRTSRPIRTPASRLIPDLLDLASLAPLASRPALLAQELFVLLRDTGCASALAVVSMRAGARPAILAHEGWTADAAAAAARAPATATSIPCGRDGDDELRVVVAPKDDAQAQALVHALGSHTERLVAHETLGRSERARSSPWPPEPPIQGEVGVFASPAMRRLAAAAKQVAASRLPVLITGESGTGKEVLARLIHRHSGRADRDFIPYNCTGAPRDMMDSQLFGHRRGSFTGAWEHAPGLVRAAGGGTLLLDEVAELDLQTQPKLLRLLENGEVQPLGEARPVRVDVRVVAATNADLSELVRAGRFRKDLYFRLNAVCLSIPPLRERRDDIPPLVHYFLRRYGAEHGRPHLRLAHRTLGHLVRHEWPGNVRQLSNEMRRVAAFADHGGTIAPEHLSPDVRQGASDAPAAPARDAAEMQVTVNATEPLAAAVATVERALIRRALETTEGRLDDAARLLGLSRKGLFLKRRRLGIHSRVA